MSVAHLRSGLIESKLSQSKPNLAWFCFSLFFIYSIYSFLSKCEHQRKMPPNVKWDQGSNIWNLRSGSSSSSNWLEVLKRRWKRKLRTTWGRRETTFAMLRYTVYVLYIYILYIYYVYIYMYCIIWDTKRRAGTWKWYGVYYCSLVEGDHCLRFERG